MLISPMLRQGTNPFALSGPPRSAYDRAADLVRLGSWVRAQGYSCMIPPEELLEYCDSFVKALKVLGQEFVLSDIRQAILAPRNYLPVT